MYLSCAALQRALDEGAPVRTLRAATGELLCCLSEHFGHEERQMRAGGYAHYAWHRRQHHAARSQATRFEKRIRRGDRQAAAEMLSFLDGWLNDHICIADRMLAAFLRNQQRATHSR